MFGNIFHVNILYKHFNCWVQIEIDGKIVEKVFNLHILGKLIPYEEKDFNIRIQAYNKMNGIIERYFGNCLTTDKIFSWRDIISKTALLVGGETLGNKKKEN